MFRHPEVVLRKVPGDGNSKPLLEVHLNRQNLAAYLKIAILLSACIRNIQGESLARGPKLLYIKNYVIEIMT